MTSIVLAAALAASGTLAAQQSARLVVTSHATHLDSLAREPMVVQLPSGTLVASGYSQTIASAWRSADNGVTWTRIDTRPEANGLLGNSDVALAIAPDGTLYWAAMVFDRSKGEGVAVNVGVSTDDGVSWRWTTAVHTRFDDRPWIGVAADGTVHLVWNDGRGVHHSTSTDRGATFTEGVRASARGGSSAFAIGPHGELAVRVVPISASGNIFAPGVDQLAISTDGGVTWRAVAMPGTRDWRAFDDTSAAAKTTPATPRWEEPVAFDSTGALYVAWTDRGVLHLARSTDLGANWHEQGIARGAAMLYYPFLFARGDGDLAVTWFSGSGDSLRLNVSRLSARRLAEGEPIALESFGLSSRPEDPNVRSCAGEYAGVTILRDGTVAVIAPVQNERAGRFGFEFWRFTTR